jgi:ubiquinone/menaquinone biosynthesis C-methylase UbiE
VVEARDVGRHRAVVARQFDALARDYARGQARRLPADRLLRLAALRGDERVLDVATGTGAAAWALAERARVVVGVDVSDGMLAAAQAAGGDRTRAPLFVRADAERLPFPDGSFDVAVCSRALHHMPRPERALAEVARALAPGGRLVLVDSITYEEPGLAAEHNRLERLRDPSHARMLPRSELERVVAAAGFALRSVEVAESARPLATWLEDAATPPAVGERIAAELAAGGALAAAHVVALPDGERGLRYRLAWLAAELAA